MTDAFEEQRQKNLIAAAEGIKNILSVLDPMDRGPVLVIATLEEPIAIFDSVALGGSTAEKVIAAKNRH